MQLDTHQRTQVIPCWLWWNWKTGTRAWNHTHTHAHACTRTNARAHVHTSVVQFAPIEFFFIWYTCSWLGKPFHYKKPCHCSCILKRENHYAFTLIPHQKMVMYRLKMVMYLCLSEHMWCISLQSMLKSVFCVFCFNFVLKWTSATPWQRVGARCPGYTRTNVKL